MRTISFDASVITWTDRYAQSTIFSGCPCPNFMSSPVWPVSVLATAYPRRSPVAIAVSPIPPEYPPLPTPSNLPFQASAGGIQTSNLISESLVGRAVASTRQNAGSVIAADAPGAVNGPAATVAADLTVTFGIVSAARFEQAVPPVAAGVATCASTGTSAAARAAARRRDIRPPGSVIIEPAVYCGGTIRADVSKRR